MTDYDLSPAVAIARDLDTTCKVIILAPLALYGVLSSSLGEDLFPFESLALMTVIGAYALVGTVLLQSWGTRGIDPISWLAISAFLLGSVVLLIVYGPTETKSYWVTFALLLSSALAPLLVALARVVSLRRRTRQFPISLRACVGWHRFAKIPPRKAVRSVTFLLYLEFAAGLLAAVFWFMLVSKYLDNWPRVTFYDEQMLGVMQYGLTVPFFLYAFKRKRMAEQLRALSIEEASTLDRRLPLLFLRSFADDDLHVRRVSVVQLDHVPFACPAMDPRFWGQLIRLEEVLARSLWFIGPLVAIGAPNDPVPQLGALRSYYANNQWQAKVRALMERSRLIFVVPSSSEWVRWELELLSQLGLQAKTVFLLPQGPLQAQMERWTLALSALGELRGPDSPVFNPRARALLIRGGRCVALLSEDFDESALAVLAKVSADLSLRA